MTTQAKGITREEVLRRYPSMVSHLVCQSLGYFTPQNAAGAVAAHIRGEEWYCEWYSHMTGLRLKQKLPGERRLTELEWTEEALKVNREMIEAAFKYRHTHTGMMAHYPDAKALVNHVRKGGDCPVFASWM